MERKRFLFGFWTTEAVAEHIATFVRHTDGRTFLGTSASQLVVVPTASHVGWVRNVLAEQGASYVGLRIVSLRQFEDWAFDASGFSSRIVKTPELCLLVREMAERSEDNEIRRLARDASRVVALHEKFISNGAGFEGIASPAIRNLACQLNEWLRARNLVSRAMAIQALKETDLPEVELAIFVGVTPLQWSSFPLIRTVCRHSETAVVFHLYPPDADATEIEHLCVELFEGDFGVEITTEESRGDSLSFISLENTLPDEVSFRIASSLYDEAEQIAEEAMRLIGAGNKRLGILVPEDSPVAQLVSDRLLSLNIPHFNEVGIEFTGLLDQALWLSWLDLQERFSAKTLMNYLETGGRKPCEIALREIYSWISSAQNSLLTDDLAVIGAYLSEKNHETAQKVGQFIKGIERIPDRAPMRRMLEHLKALLTTNNFSSQFLLIQDAFFQSFAGKGNIEALSVGRSSFIEWLRSLSTLIRNTPRMANESFARIHILPYKDAVGQHWDAVIAAGSGSLEWSLPVTETGLDERIITGSVFAPSDHDLSVQANREIVAMLRRPSSLTFIYSLHDERSPSTRARPSLPFELFWQECHKQAFSDDDAQQLINAHRPTLPREKAELEPLPGDFESMLEAWKARRDETKPFDEYCFALKTPPEETPAISASNLEVAASDPAHVWMKVFARAEDLYESTDRFAACVGSLAHNLLRKLVVEHSSFTGKTPAIGEALSRIREALKATQSVLNAPFASVGKTPSALLGNALDKAAWYAESLALRLLSEKETLPECMLTETAIIDPVEVPFGEYSLRIHGTIDALFTTPEGRVRFLATRKSSGSDVLESDDGILLIDYKTGRYAPMSVKKILNGEGIQIAAYMLILERLGFRNIQAAVVRRDSSFSPQVNLEDIKSCDSVFKRLAWMQSSGVFGYSIEQESKYGFSRKLPMALLPVPASVIEKKHALTFGPFLNA